MFKNQPKGLYVLSLANTGERFGYFTVVSVFILYLQSKFGFDTAITGQIYAGFMAVVYFMPVIGGFVADRWSFSKCVTAGFFVMAVGYLIVAYPAEIFSSTAKTLLFAGLALICIGTGLFKSNLQVMIGDLYNDPRYESKRDSGFSIFYMAINVGAMFAPAMATWVLNRSLAASGFVYNNRLPELCRQFVGGDTSVGDSIAAAAQSAGMSVDSVEAFSREYLVALSNGYGFSFGVAFVSLIVSYLIYYLGRSTYRHLEASKKVAAAASQAQPELTAAQTRGRVVALLLVFAVVIFFWMVFMQNGATLTEFAKSCTSPDAWGWTRIGFNVWALLAVAVAVFAIFGIFQSKKVVWRVVSSVVAVCAAVVIALIYHFTPNPVEQIQPQDYQQFNGFYIIALTPVSLAFFGWLASRKKEPSAPRKIGYGMVVAALAYGVMVIGSLAITGTSGNVSGNWLISTYLLLTISELLLSPMGLSFVSKVAPPKFKGLMMGCWFLSTAIGNYLVSIPMLLWGKIPVWLVWLILASLCVISATIIFLLLKKLEALTK